MTIFSYKITSAIKRKFLVNLKIPSKFESEDYP